MPEGIISSYQCQMRTEEPGVMKVKPRDILRIDVTIAVRYSNSLYVVETSTLLKSSIPISCQNLLENNEDFVRSLLFDPRCSDFFTPETVDQVSEKMVNMIKGMLEFCSGPESADSESQELPFNLDITVDVEREEEQNAATIPASAEAIDSLKTFTISSFLGTKTEKCNICLKEFRFEENEEDVKLSSMPCDHVFHYRCIVKWLQMSHTCPLCRYPMPTDNN